MTSNEAIAAAIRGASFVAIGMIWAATKKRRAAWLETTRFPFFVDNLWLFVWGGLIGLGFSVAWIMDWIEKNF
jgi:hypothetical protein